MESQGPYSRAGSLPEGKLSFKEKISYGVGDMANGLALSSTAFYLLYYLTDVAKLSPEMAGLALMLGRAWNAITDPVMGWLVDRTNSRWGKKRPYLLFGAPTYGLFFFSLWIVPDLGSSWLTFFYVAATLILFDTFLAVVFIPYQTLTASLTTDYNERTSLTGYRMALSQIAFLVGATFPALVVSWAVTPEGVATLKLVGFAALFGEWVGRPQGGYAAFAAFFSIVMVVVIWISFWGTKERAGVATNAPASQALTPWAYIAQLYELVRSNQAFRTSLWIKLLSTSAATLVSAKLKYYVEYVLGMGPEFPKIIGALFVGAISAVPLWVFLSKKLGKVEAFRLGMWGYIIVLLALLLLGKGETLWIYPLAVVAGVFHSAALLIPWTIIPDVVEVDEYETGSRREGLLYGGTSFAYKLGSAGAIFLAGIILGAVGYEPHTEIQPHTVTGILWFVSLAPIALLLWSILASRRFPISAERHREIVAELRERAAGIKKT